MCKKIKEKTFAILQKCKNKTIIYSTLIGFFSVLAVVLLVSLWPQNTGQNETYAELSELSTKIRTYYKMRPDFWGLNTKEVALNNLLPSTMSFEGEKLKGFWGKEIVIGANENGDAVLPSQRNFVITYKGLNKEQCVALADKKIGENFWFGVEKILISSGEEKQFFNWGTTDFSLPANKKEVKKVCKNNNVVAFYLQ